MADPVSIVKANNETALRSLGDATAEAKKFASSKLGSIIPPSDALRSSANEELSFGRVMVGDDGFTTGMRLHVIQPVLDLIAEWKRVESVFEGAFHPFIKDVDALDELDREIEAEKAQRATISEQIEKRAEADGSYAGAKKKFAEAETRFIGMRDRQGRRVPNLKSYSLWYGVFLAFILVAEILINYHTFLFFLGIPAIAAGTTIVMGILLAFAADKHGAILRQAHVIFAKDVDRAERASERNALIFATLAFLVVITTAGASRYEYAVHIMVSLGDGSILGPDSHIEVNPMKDVLLSLMGNIAAWMVGVFLSYFCHDKDPHYAEAAHEVRKTEAAFVKVRRPFDEEKATEEARLQRDIEEKERSAKARSADVAVPRDMRSQMATLKESVLDACLAALRRGIDQYRNFVLQGSIAKPSEIILLQGDKQMTSYEYQAVKLVLDKDILMRLSQ